MITMVGYDRTFQPPRSLRHAASGCDVNHPVLRRFMLGQITTWDMLNPVLASVPGGREWAERTVGSQLAAAASPGVNALGCQDCEDTGFYGQPDADDDDTLVRLFRRTGDNCYQVMTADGTWHDWTFHADDPVTLEVLSLELAQDLADAVLTGAAGLTRRFYWPVAFLPPGAMLAATPGLPDQPPAASSEWSSFAIVDDLDTGAVLQVVRIKPGPELERYDKSGQWVQDPNLLSQLQGVKPPPLVELDEQKLKDVLAQIDQGADANANVPATAAGLVADAPLTVSPDPRAEKLRRYWTSGKGAAKIRWGTPGDWKRCYRHLSKFMGTRAKGYCQNLHKRATGVWTGSRANPGRRGSLVATGAMSTEESLVAAIQAQTWSGESGRTVTMVGIKDGIYEETVEDQFQAIVRGLTAGAFPVKPPDEWFDNPRLGGLTPLTVEDSGQVYGHLASFEMPHIGLPGKVRAPKSHSGYAYFMTGAIPTRSGKRARVGQLTLAGGHAPLNADAGSAVAHYDNTNSAIADVSVGEDRYGIWFAGALRPEATPEKVRAFMASSLSGDWRPINGHLEMVACCSVNVPGFPIARAMAAGGALVSLVAAGARPIAVKKASMLADAAVVERLAALETAVYEAAPAVEEVIEETTTTTQPSVDNSEEEPDDKIARARKLVAERKEKRRQELRDRVHGQDKDKASVAAGGASPKV